MHGFKFLPSPVDEPVGTYLAQIRCVLAIEAEQEYALAKSWRENGDPEAERRLIASHLRLVAKIAWAYRGYGLPFSKLIQEGNRALVEAVRRFDPDRGLRLAAFVRSRIEGALVDHVLAWWPQVKAGSAAEKMTLFFDLCRLKAGLTARSQWRSSHRSAALSSRSSTRNMNTSRLQPSANRSRRRSCRRQQPFVSAWLQSEAMRSPEPKPSPEILSAQRCHKFIVTQRTKS
jgi:RNA polymerase sigma factor (sigma-70 family)